MNYTPNEPPRTLTAAEIEKFCRTVTRLLWWIRS